MNQRPTPETDKFSGNLGDCIKFAERLERERDELAELVDGAHILVELYKPEGEYNKGWREQWLEKAKRLVPGCDSIWY